MIMIVFMTAITFRSDCVYIFHLQKKTEWQLNNKHRFSSSALFTKYISTILYNVAKWIKILFHHKTHNSETITEFTTWTSNTMYMKWKAWIRNYIWQKLLKCIYISISYYQVYHVYKRCLAIMLANFYRLATLTTCHFCNFIELYSPYNWAICHFQTLNWQKQLMGMKTRWIWQC